MISSCLGSTSASRGSVASAARREAASTTLEGASPASLGLSATTTTDAASLHVWVRSGLQATLLNDDTIVADLVRIRIDSGFVSLCCLEVDESAVLLGGDIKVDNLAKLLKH